MFSEKGEINDHQYCLCVVDGNTLITEREIIIIITKERGKA